MSGGAADFPNQGDECPAQPVYGGGGGGGSSSTGHHRGSLFEQNLDRKIRVLLAEAAESFLASVNCMGEEAGQSRVPGKCPEFHMAGG